MPKSVVGRFLHAGIRCGHLFFAAYGHGHSLISFLNGNTSLVRNPVNEMGYSGEARKKSLGATRSCAIARDTQINDVATFSDGQSTATVTLKKELRLFASVHARATYIDDRSLKTRNSRCICSCCRLHWRSTGCQGWDHKSFYNRRGWGENRQVNEL